MRCARPALQVAIVRACSPQAAWPHWRRQPARSEVLSTVWPRAVDMRAGRKVGASAYPRPRHNNTGDDAWLFETGLRRVKAGARHSRDPKAITGRPSSARRKLSDPFLRASRNLRRRYQLLRARADSHEPRILQAVPTSHAPSGHGGHPCPAAPKMADLSESVLLPFAKASPGYRC